MLAFVSCILAKADPKRGKRGCLSCFLTPILLGGFFFSFSEQVTFGKTGSGKCAVFVFFCDCFGLVCREEFGMSLVVFVIRLGFLF